jgi:hypothetical protein
MFYYSIFTPPALPDVSYPDATFTYTKAFEQNAGVDAIKTRAAASGHNVGVGGGKRIERGEEVITIN